MTASEIPGVSPTLAAALSSDRQIYNAQLAMLRSRQPELDFNAVKEFLCSAIDPIVRAVQFADPDRCRLVTQACFQQMLALSEHGLLGNDARSIRIKLAWQQVMPKLASNLARDPAAILAWVTNAVDRIANTQNARPESWINAMASVAPNLESVEQIHVVGQVLAWRAGMAHYRQGALKAARNLTERIGNAVFPSNPDGWLASVERHLIEPWWRGEQAARSTVPHGVRVGAFAGWDGAFMAPPKLRPATEGFWVASGERYFHLVADAFGAVLIPSSEVHFTSAAVDGTASEGVHLRGEQLQTHHGHWPLPLIKNDLAVTCNADTVCVSSPWSHHIWLYPR